MAKWIKRKTRTMVECDVCKALICWNKMNGAKFDEYWQRAMERDYAQIVICGRSNTMPKAILELPKMPERSDENAG